jgi:hypothetical protein
VTNRQLYLRVLQVAEKAAIVKRPLEVYLRGLLAVCRGMREVKGMTCEGFVEVLEAGLTAEPAAFDEGWRGMVVETLLKSAGFAGTELALERQVVDLREMEAAGTLAREDRYFGVFAPRGSRWYNFDVGTFLECGAVGTFGGWEPGDEGGRELVQGKVLVMGEKGFESVDAADVKREVWEVAGVEWEMFRTFLGMGQSYE